MESGDAWRASSSQQGPRFRQPDSTPDLETPMFLGDAVKVKVDNTAPGANHIPRLI
jgi:hypothetical protein